MSFDTLNANLGLSDGLKGIYVKGKVVTNVDPENLDRIQVSVPGLYDPDLGPLPWISKLKDSPFGQGDGYGVFGTPAVGSDVAILLQNGDVHYPLYVADLQAFVNPGDFPSGAAWGWLDPAGNKLVVQGKDVKLTTGAGFIFHVDENGSYTVTAPSGQTGTYNVPHVVWNVTDFTINASADVDISSQDFNVTTSTRADINGVLISSNGDTIMPGTLIVEGAAAFNTLAAFNLGVSITGPATANGHDISQNHKHYNASGSVTGIVST